MEQNFFCKFDESVTQSNVLSFSKTASSIVLSEPVSWREKIFTTQQDDSIIRWNLDTYSIEKVLSEDLAKDQEG